MTKITSIRTVVAPQPYSKGESDSVESSQQHLWIAHGDAKVGSHLLNSHSLTAWIPDGGHVTILIGDHYIEISEDGALITDASISEGTPAKTLRHPNQIGALFDFDGVDPMPEMDTRDKREEAQAREWLKARDDPEALRKWTEGV